MIKKFTDIEKEIEQLRVNGNPKGEQTGFKCLDELFTIKQGSYTFILAAPHHGKSEFCFELLLSQALKYGKKSLVYSPETGSVSDIYAELIKKYTGKSIYKSSSYSVDDKEFYNAVNFIDNHFTILDSEEKAYSFSDITKLVTDEDLLMIDPYNEMLHDMTLYNGRQDLYIEDFVSDIRRYCKKNKKHCFLTLHPANQQIETKGDLRFYPMPMARQAAGGQALFRKAMTWINMWRPQIGLLNEQGMPYEANEVLIQIEKAKPKGVAKLGKTTLFFDWKKNRYYEKIEHADMYAFEHENIKPIQQPSAIMPSPTYTQTEAPF